MAHPAHSLSTLLTMVKARI